MSCDANTQAVGQTLEASPKVITNFKMECEDEAVGEAVGEASEIFKCMINWISNVNYSYETVSNCIKWAKE